MSHYYQPSNRFSLGGVLLLLIAGSLAAVLLAFIYVYAVWYIPFIYINALITVGFGVILGAVLSALVRAGKIRSPGLAGMLALAVGMVAYVVQWGVYLMLLLNITSVDRIGRRASVAHTSFDANTLLGLLLKPSLMLSTIGELAETGSWSLFGATPSGVFLYLIWLVEAVIIIGAAVILARSQAAKPYSETAGEWAREDVLPGTVAYVHDLSATKAALEAGDFGALSAQASDEEPNQFAQIKLYCAPNDSECAFLSLENIEVTIDDKGKRSNTITDVVSHLRISAQRCRELRKTNELPFISH